MTLFLRIFIPVLALTLSPMGVNASEQSPGTMKKPSDPNDMYTTKIEPIFNSRCISCHACTDSPCNLKLTSYEGLLRGGSRFEPYDSNLVKKEMIRLGKDAKTVEQWRKKGFSEVVNQSISASPGQRLKTSLLYKFVTLGEKNNIPGEKLHRIQSLPPANISCPRSIDEFDDLFSEKGLKLKISLPPPFNKFLKKSNPQSLGMPFGLPSLSPEQMSLIKTWIGEGSPGPTQTTMDLNAPVKSKDLVDDVEKFLNRGVNLGHENDELSKKHRWTAKYLYEHLFLAHLHHAKFGGEFFMLIRSRTQTGPIDEVVTEFPFDDPGEKFWYRLQKLKSAIVYKNHITYSVDENKLARIRELFIETPWPMETAQGGDGIPEVNWDSPNPFENFAPIPAKIRYKWMIENSKLMVDSFTRGPVCNGALATYAVRDYFWVMFLDPDSDISVNMPRFFERKYRASAFDIGGTTIRDLLLIPDFIIDEKKVGLFFRPHQYTYERSYAKMMNEWKPVGYSVDDIWDGSNDSKVSDSSHNPNALLTVYRHELSVSVGFGRAGSEPNTAWALDYPGFERIYYDLVAAFSVTSPAAKKIFTRTYAEHLRREAEDRFIAFLPEKMRRPVRDSWYDGGPGKLAHPRKPFFFKKIKSNVTNVFQKECASLWRPPELAPVGDDNPELAGKRFMRRLTDCVLPPQTVGPSDIINDHRFLGTTYKGALPSSIENEERLQSILTTIADVKGEFTRYFQNVSYIFFTREGKAPLYYTVILNVAHKTMNILFNEDGSENPKNNVLNIFKDRQVSYPNQFYTVPLKQAPRLVKAILAINSKEDYQKFEQTYGIHKWDANFWEHFDQLQDHFFAMYPVFAGYMDLSRYGSHNQRWLMPGKK